MTKTELKHEARDAIMHSMGVAFYALEDRRDLNSDEKNLRASFLLAEYRRVEKFLGYVPGSWTPG